MGRGDKRTKRGKITIGSFGKVRPARTPINKGTATEATAAEPKSKKTTTKED